MLCWQVLYLRARSPKWAQKEYILGDSKFKGCSFEVMATYRSNSILHTFEKGKTDVSESIQSIMLKLDKGIQAIKCIKLTKK